ncbi:hypothetical protein ECTW07793_0416 [Escherichia coli TW07793]|nr:hypothetical protein ECTW07793_0416 [Escherichia coli TW07793]
MIQAVTASVEKNFYEQITGISAFDAAMQIYWQLSRRAWLTGTRTN